MSQKYSCGVDCVYEEAWQGGGAGVTGSTAAAIQQKGVLHAMSEGNVALCAIPCLAWNIANGGWPCVESIDAQASKWRRWYTLHAIVVSM